MPRTQTDVIEQNIQDAVRILTHYVMLALPDADEGDTRAEMKDIVIAIVTAAALTAGIR